MLTSLLERICRIPPQPTAPGGVHARADVFRASPRFLSYRTALWAVGAVPIGLVSLAPLGIALFGHVSRKDSEILLWLGFAAPLVWAAVFGLAYLALRLDWRYRWYLVTDRSLRVREGILIVREMTVTFANVQNISVQQGPLQRVFGIADVKVDTAGGGAVAPGKHRAPGANLHTAWLRGVDNAPHIRDLIQGRLKGSRDAGLGDAEDAAHNALSSTATRDAAMEVLAEARALRMTMQRAVGLPVE